MYGGYAWLTNAVAPDGTGRRLLLLDGMAGFLILALVIPRAFRRGCCVRAGVPRRRLRACGAFHADVV